MGRASLEDFPQVESIQLDTTPGDSSPSPDIDVDSENEHGVSLPPVDTGRDAMLFLAACTIIECLVWGQFKIWPYPLNTMLANKKPGFPFAFGIFQNYYSTHAPFMGSSNIAAIGTTAMVDCAPPFFMPSLEALVLIAIIITGNHVLIRPIRLPPHENVSQAESIWPNHRPPHHVHSPRAELLLADCLASDFDPGRPFRHRWFDLLRPLHPVHGRVVR